MRSIRLISLLLLPIRAMAGTYSTTFPVAENPISEGGHWVNGKTTGLDWSDCSITNHLAVGMQVGPSGFDDSTAILTGTWGPTQQVTIVSYISGSENTYYREIECRLRSLVAAHTNRGYEVLWDFRADSDTPYVSIVRWNGALDSFDYILQTNASYTPASGLTLMASITNSTIRAYINGTLVATGTDTTWTNGNPGFGFWINQLTGPTTNFGISSFTATDGITNPSISIVKRLGSGQLGVATY